MESPIADPLERKRTFKALASEFPSFRLSEFRSFWISESRSLRIYDFGGFWFSEFQNFGVCEFQDFGIWEFQKLRNLSCSESSHPPTQAKQTQLLLSNVYWEKTVHINWSHPTEWNMFTIIVSPVSVTFPSLYRPKRIIRCAFLSDGGLNFLCVGLTHRIFQEGICNHLGAIKQLPPLSSSKGAYHSGGFFLYERCV